MRINYLKSQFSRQTFSTYCTSETGASIYKCNVNNFRQIIKANRSFITICWLDPWYVTSALGIRESLVLSSILVSIPVCHEGERGSISSFLLSTLQRWEEHRRCDLIHIAVKSRSILFDRLRTEIRKWERLQPRGNRVGIYLELQKPPYRKRIPMTLGCLRLLAFDTAYITPPGRTDTPKSYKRRIYNTTRILLRKGKSNGPALAKHGLEDRIEKLSDHPGVWRNQIDMVQINTCHNPHQRAARQNPSRSHRPV